MSERSWGALVAAVVALVGLATALSLRRDAALELGALAVAAILLALPLVGRLAVLRHGVIVTTIDPELERALVVGGLAFAAGVIAAAARAWWPTHAALVREPRASATTGMITSMLERTAEIVGYGIGRRDRARRSRGSPAAVWASYGRPSPAYVAVT